MADPFAIIANYGSQGNAGDAFAQLFKQGQVDNRQNMARSAMARLVQAPNDAQALAALAQVDPQSAMEFRQQQATLAKSQLAEHQDSILKGAEILRQFQPKDQASYSAALSAAQQAGIDVSQVPQQYNQQYVDGVIHIADALSPDAQDPGIIREYDEATKRGLVPPGTSYEQYVQMRNPGMTAPVTVPFGATVSSPGDMPTVATPQEAAKLPPGTKFRLQDGRIGTVPGGAGGNAGGGF